MKDKKDREETAEPNMNNTGKVWLVGAGPGDAGLFTLKGRDVLRKADVVIYDALVGGGILSMMPGDAEIIYAGKRAGRHTLRQDEINRLLLEKAWEGKRVVRLKGGDPFVFGRGGEELELLSKHGIPFEVVPGVTSAFAAPAYAGIPVTHRDCSSSVTVVTGHRRQSGELDIDFDALAHTGGTLVFVMGMSSLGGIRARLLAAGMDPKMPAAIIEKGTTGSQRVLLSDLDNITAVAAADNAAAPAAVVIGRAASFADSFSWRDKLPLAGVKAVITRPGELCSQLAGMLRERGAEVIELPAVSIEPVTDDPALDHAIEMLGCRGAADAEDGEAGYDWIVFTSPSGVRVFMHRLLRDADVRLLAGCRIASMGRGTSRELAGYGLRADMMPSVSDGATLGRELAAMLSGGEHILIPRARIGGRELIEELSKVSGVLIDDIATYDTVCERHKWFDAEKALDEPCTYVLFTSASTVRGFAQAYPGIDCSKVNAVCIGRMTGAEAEKHGMRTWVSDEATLESLAGRLAEVCRRGE